LIDSILFISTKYTGHGHQSITESISNQISMISPQTKTEILEGFELGGKPSRMLGHLYGPVTHYAKPIWASYYQTFHHFPGLANTFTTSIITKHRELLQIINKTNPEIIVTVHPAFVGSIIDLLENQNLNIPVITVVADIISINRLWADKRAMYTICPSEEAKEKVIQYGVPESKVKVFGFPVREKFNNIAASINEDTLAYKPNKEGLNFLIVSGAEGAGNLAKTATILLDSFDCKVTIITGRNQKLRAMLEKSLPSAYPNRAVVLGFVNNIEDYLIASDILITRASPNTFMEAVNCCVPLVVTDTLPGQEKENPNFILKHNLGIFCKDLTLLPKEINGLLADNGKRLVEIRRAQLKYRDLDTNKNIAQFLLSI